jgi:hypothetical protein
MITVLLLTILAGCGCGKNVTRANGADLAKASQPPDPPQK